MMNVLILAAGNSRRMGKLTRKIPKSMLKYRGAMLIDRLFENLTCLNDVGDVNIVTGYKSKTLAAHVYNKWSSYRPVICNYTNTFSKRGHAYSLLFGLRKIKNNEPTLVVHADAYFDPDYFRGSISKFLETNASTLILGEQNDQDSESNFYLNRSNNYSIDKEPSSCAIGVITGLFVLSPSDQFLIKRESRNPQFLNYFQYHNWEYFISSLLESKKVEFLYKIIPTSVWKNVNYPSDLVE